MEEIETGVDPKRRSVRTVICSNCALSRTLDTKIISISERPNANPLHSNNTLMAEWTSFWISFWIHVNQSLVIYGAHLLTLPHCVSQFMYLFSFSQYSLIFSIEARELMPKILIWFVFCFYSFWINLLSPKKRKLHRKLQPVKASYSIFIWRSINQTSLLSWTHQITPNVLTTVPSVWLRKDNQKEKCRKIDSNYGWRWKMVFETHNMR